MNIGSNNKGVAGRLSNFTARPFVFNKIKCASMEGLLQSLKFDKPRIQEEVCKLTGFAAKKRGSKRNKAWKSKQVLWWNGVEYSRKGHGYQNLLSRMFIALSENKKFAKDLLSTGSAVFKHSIGKNKESETVLTEREFCEMLTMVRTYLRNNLTH